MLDQVASNNKVKGNIVIKFTFIIFFSKAFQSCSSIRMLSADQNKINDKI